MTQKRTRARLLRVTLQDPRCQVHWMVNSRAAHPVSQRRNGTSRSETQGQRAEPDMPADGGPPCAGSRIYARANNGCNFPNLMKILRLQIQEVQ